MAGEFVFLGAEGSQWSYDAREVTQLELGGRAVNMTVSLKWLRWKTVWWKLEKEQSLWGAVSHAMCGSGEVEAGDEAAEEGLSNMWRA